jgi:organic radical activating enzyme|tara:strand:+ start:6282 stop:7466 length:1185 start_codon:yes stop_codon:yes gene_type:complete
MTTINKHFCVKAFTGVEIRANGHVVPCCDFNSNVTQVTYNLQNYTLDEITHAEHWQTLRQNMLDDKPSVNCVTCYRNEEVGITSQRQNTNNRFNDQAIHYITKNDASIHSILDIDMKLGNVCNQMCVVCNSASSSMLFNEDEIIWPGKGVTFKNKWWQTPEIWDSIIEKCKHAKIINVYGGEPLLVKQMTPFMRKLVDSGISKNIEINFATNGSIYEEEMFDMLMTFKRRNILLSGDGSGKTFDYNRYPAKWDQFIENMHLIQSRLLPIDFIANAYTYSAYSIFDVIQTSKYYNEQLDFTLPIWLNPVNQDFYAIEMLPDPIKQSLINEIEQTYNLGYVYTGSTNLAPLVQQLKRPRVEAHWQEFKRITKMRDKMRNISILDIIPELEGYWHED